MNSRKNRPSTWLKKFGHAVRGIRIAVSFENSFSVHLVVATVVVIVGVWLRISPLRWSLLSLCMAIVLMAELLNTAIERLARAITEATNPEIRDALDLAAGAVLIVSLGAVVVGCLLFVGPLMALLG